MSVLLNASVIRDADGQCVSSRSTVFDITERNRANKTSQSRPPFCNPF